jgi:hypothetical protein
MKAAQKQAVARSQRARDESAAVRLLVASARALQAYDEVFGTPHDEPRTTARAHPYLPRPAALEHDGARRNY